MAHSVSALYLLWKWINFSPQDCQCNITPKTKFKKKKKNCREEELEYLSIFFFFPLLNSGLDSRREEKKIIVSILAPEGPHYWVG